MATKQRKPRATYRGKETAPSPSFLSSWIDDVTSILSKPPLAMTLFLLGIIFVIVASKQAKLVIDVLEYYQVNVRQNGVASHFLAIAVFVLVWLDILLLMVIKAAVRKGMVLLFSGYDILAEILDEMATREHRKLKTLRNKKR